MNEFPEFMRNPKNLIRTQDQNTEDVEGFVFGGGRTGRKNFSGKL